MREPSAQKLDAHQGRDALGVLGFDARFGQRLQIVFSQLLEHLQVEGYHVQLASLCGSDEPQEVFALGSEHGFGIVLVILQDRGEHHSFAKLARVNTVRVAVHV